METTHLITKKGELLYAGSIYKLDDGYYIQIYSPPAMLGVGPFETVEQAISQVIWSLGKDLEAIIPKEEIDDDI